MTFPESESEEGPPTKRLKLEEADEDNETATPVERHFLHLCDDILLEIFSYLNPYDLYTLGRVCQRLEGVIRDRTLWEHVDLRRYRIRRKQLELFIEFLLPTTKSLAIRGNWEPEEEIWDGETEQPEVLRTPYVDKTISGDMLIEIANKAPLMTSFVFENQSFDCDDIEFNLFWQKLPGELEELGLKTCYLGNCHKHKAFFSEIYKYLPCLKILDLSGCRWLQPHSFLALSKCKLLEELRMAGCELHDFVPYVSLGTRFGFQALTVLDLRRTWVSDREVSCFDKTTTLRELYLESPGGHRGPFLISDLAVTAFGGSLDSWNKMGYIVMFLDHFSGFKKSMMSVIELCDYKNVTDTSLRHCAGCLTALKRLNVKGTSCTLNGIVDFKSKRPDVTVVSNFDSEVLVDPSDSNEENNQEVRN